MEHIEKGNAGEAQPLTVGVLGLGSSVGALPRPTLVPGHA